VQQNTKTSSVGTMHEATKTAGKKSTKQIRNETQQAVKQRRQNQRKVSRKRRNLAGQSKRLRTTCESRITRRELMPGINRNQTGTTGNRTSRRKLRRGKPAARNDALGNTAWESDPRTKAKRLKRKPVAKNRMQREQKNRHGRTIRSGNNSNLAQDKMQMKSMNEEYKFAP
jgi:hypothetical protein